jgi:hypothetical protein
MITFHQRYWNFDVKSIEEKLNAKFVLETSLKNHLGIWSDFPIQVYYVENPDFEKGHSHYVGVFKRNGSAILMNAEQVEDIVFSAKRIGDEIIYSAYRHEFVSSKTNPQIFIDGGRDYTRASLGGGDICFVIKDGVIHE